VLLTPLLHKYFSVAQNARLRLAFWATVRQVTPAVVQRCFGYASHFAQLRVCEIPKKNFFASQRFFLKLRKPDEPLAVILRTTRKLTKYTK
jgi:hypothetical protein